MALKAARAIVRDKGVSALSTRVLADRIGYSSGTLYQIFKNRDDVVEQVNIETLALLYDHCNRHTTDNSVPARLRELAGSFISFAQANPREWDAIINYPFAPDHDTSQAYQAQIDRLLQLLCDAVAEFYDDDQAELKLRDARLLWNSLYGIFSLAAAGRLSEDRSDGDAVEDLIDLYVAARS